MATPVPAGVRGWAGSSVVLSGVNFTLTTPRTLAATDDAGALTWATGLPAVPGTTEPFEVTLDVAAGQVLVQRGYQSGRVSRQRLDVVDPTARARAWSYDWAGTGGSSPLLVAGVLVVPLRDGSGTAGLDPSSGRVRWTATTLTDPVVSSGVLLAVEATDQATVRLDAVTGRVSWRHSSHEPSSSTPIWSSDVQQVVGSTLYLWRGGTLTALDVVSGALRWQVPMQVQDAWGILPGDAGAVLLFALGSWGQVEVSAWDAATGGRRAVLTVGGTAAADYELRCGDATYLIVMPDDGPLRLLDGQAAQTRELGGMALNGGHTNIALQGGTLLYLGEGRLRAIAVPDLTESWRVPVDPDVYLIDRVTPTAVVLSTGTSQLSYEPPRSHAESGSIGPVVTP